MKFYFIIFLICLSGCVADKENNGITFSEHATPSGSGYMVNDVSINI